MEFIDLKTQYVHMEEEIRKNIDRVLDHGKYIMGPEVEQLEVALAGMVKTKHCITCGNGTDALQMVLMAWGVGPGDAVFVPSFTFMSTAEVVRLVGAIPYFVDCELNTYNICPTHLETVITDVQNKGVHNPRVIIPVDLFGRIANYEEIEKIAIAHDLLILEDAAQSMGSTLNGKAAGSYGHAATTSFFPAKPLGCYGDGGAVFTNDDELAGVLKSIRVHGQGTDKYDNIRVGLNTRLDTFQAAILIAKLNGFNQELAERQRVAATYTKHLGKLIVVPTLPRNSISAWAQYSILTKSTSHRCDIQKVLSDNNIPSMVYYHKPLHLQEAYKDVSSMQVPCPVSEEISSRVLSLPMHPYIGEKDIVNICNLINSVEA